MINKLLALAYALNDNKKAQVKKILAAGFLEDRIEKDILFDKEFLHWLYKGDSILHLLAAAHRVSLLPNKKIYAAIVNECHNRRNATALHYAADAVVDSELYNPKDQEKTIKELINLGADVNSIDNNGATPLMRAIRCRSFIAVKTLLDHGADLKIKNTHGTDVVKMATVTSGRGHSGMKQAKINQEKILQLLKKRIS